MIDHAEASSFHRTSEYRTAGKKVCWEPFIGHDERALVCACATRQARFARDARFGFWQPVLGQPRGARRRSMEGRWFLLCNFSSRASQPRRQGFAAWKTKSPDRPRLADWENFSISEEMRYIQARENRFRLETLDSRSKGKEPASKSRERVRDRVSSFHHNANVKNYTT